MGSTHVGSTGPLTGEGEEQRVIRAPLASWLRGQSRVVGRCSNGDSEKGRVGKLAPMNTTTSFSPHTHINITMTCRHHETSHVVAIS